ncbi:MAG: hypothetical protein HC881_12270 [Leptolyngbyaceae cyanobacterium SL_7_1]|nr:hypothetical protein [Leptolyngbyaceae cyanobacterium SL_7_1]
MLKITYTETGLHLEQVSQSLEEWVALRVTLSLRTGQRLVLERCTASLLLPSGLIERCQLTHLSQQEQAGVEFASIDQEFTEVSLRGTWVSTELEATEGLFVATLPYRVEFLLFKLWQESQVYASVQ